VFEFFKTKYALRINSRGRNDRSRANHSVLRSRNELDLLLVIVFVSVVIRFVLCFSWILGSVFLSLLLSCVVWVCLLDADVLALHTSAICSQSSVSVTSSLSAIHLVLQNRFNPKRQNEV
jgi:hypothetical protein